MVDIFEQFDRLHGSDILLSFKGEVTFDLVKSILDIIEGRLETSEENIKTKRKVYNVLVECLQNLSHHIEESTDSISEAKNAILMIWTEKDFYKVGTGNYVPNDNIAKLEDRLKMINSVSRDELRNIYKEVLNNEQFSNKGGGGLGFLDIARKSGQKLKYKFDKIDDKISFFSLQVEIPK